MIRLVNVTKAFNQGRPNEFTALCDVTLSVQLGDITILKGPSGSGKTTLLSIIGCMTRPTSGRVFLSDREMTSLPERFLTGIRRETFGFIFQQFHLIKGLTALENVMIPAYPTGEKHGSLKRRALALLESLNLSSRAEAKVEWLSGGEAQRVAIARALINNPSILVADEPTAHLDTKLSHEFMENVRLLHGQGRTIIIASHDPIVFESGIAATVVDMRDGRVTGESSRP